MVVIEKRELIVDQILVGKFAIFSYLLTDSVSKEALLVDPGAEPRKILDKINDRQARLRWIVCTHAHPDHLGGVGMVKQATGASLGIHSLEAGTLRKIHSRVLVRFFGGKACPPADFTLDDGAALSLGSHAVKVIHTPGHTPGSICLVADGNLFSGDTLFVGGVGRTDLPGASWKELENSLRTRILCLPGNTRIWPGHDYGEFPTSLLRVERQENPFLRMVEARRE